MDLLEQPVRAGVKGKQLKLRYKNEIRQAIYHQVNSIEQATALQEILQLADMLRRMFDKVDYKTLLDTERAQSSIIEAILHCNDDKSSEEAMRIVNRFVRRYLNTSARS